MEAVVEPHSIGQLVADLNAILDALREPVFPLPTDRERLDALHAATRAEARLHAWRADLAAVIDADEGAWRAHGTSVSTWLADTANLTRVEAGALVRHGRELGRFALVGESAAAGDVLPQQAHAITSVLSELPDDLPDPVVEDAQRTLVGFARTHNSAELRRLSRHLLDLVAPEAAEELDVMRLERDHRLAQRSRHLTFTYDHRGSMLIRGSLPVVDAEPLVRIVEAYAAAERRALDAADPQAEYVTPAMRRADGLLAMANHHSQAALAPSHGGDRPRIVVTLTYDTLLTAARKAGVLTGELAASRRRVPAGVLRRLMCDADLLPAVLGGRSEVLDVGRTRRLVTPAIRTALELRDRGCIFPGCDKPPQDCHAHHLTPWWAGGRTSLRNLVLACPHHHGIVEPGHDPTADRWHARLGVDGVAEVVPPLRVDPRQRPRRHARFGLPSDTPASEYPPTDKPPPQQPPERLSDPGPTG